MGYGARCFAMDLKHMIHGEDYLFIHEFAEKWGVTIQALLDYGVAGHLRYCLVIPGKRIMSSTPLNEKRNYLVGVPEKTIARISDGELSVSRVYRCDPKAGPAKYIESMYLTSGTGPKGETLIEFESLIVHKIAEERFRKSNPEFFDREPNEIILKPQKGKKKKRRKKVSLLRKTVIRACVYMIEEQLELEKKTPPFEFDGDSNPSKLVSDWIDQPSIELLNSENGEKLNDLITDHSGVPDEITAKLPQLNENCDAIIAFLCSVLDWVENLKMSSSGISSQENNWAMQVYDEIVEPSSEFRKHLGHLSVARPQSYRSIQNRISSGTKLLKAIIPNLKL